MTLYLSLRSDNGVGGALAEEPYALRGPVKAGDHPTFEWLRTPAEFARAVGCNRLVIATHGFNVSLANGVRSLQRLEAELYLGPGWIFVGVLWPGDFWLPVVNYPWEADDAVRSGRRLARWLNRAITPRPVSFVSHSLGARLVMEAVQVLAWKAEALCLTAPAADDNCLTGQYRGVPANCGPISVLASKKDKTLGLAYPIGDFASDISYDNDSPWHGALGRYGSPEPVPRPVVNFPIPDTAGYDHGDYFPPGGKTAGRTKWPAVADHVRRWLLGQDETWPLQASQPR